jgi:hypothetical protein
MQLVVHKLQKFASNNKIPGIFKTCVCHNLAESLDFKTTYNTQHCIYICWWSKKLTANLF